MQESERLGECLLCGRRVYRSENYLEAEEGYCHKRCLYGTPAGAKA